MADDREVKIPISIPGAGQATKDTRQVGDAFAKLGKDVKQAGADTRTADAEQEKAAKGASKGLNELGEATEKGASAGRILREVLSGNIYALGQLGAVLKGLGAFLKGNPWGAAMTVLAAGFAFVPSILRSLGLLKDKVEEVGPAAEGSFGKAKSAAEALNESKFEEFKAELDAVASRAAAAATFIQKIYDTQAKLAQARMGLELANIEADPNLTADQKKSRGAEVRRRYAELGLVRDDERAGELLAVKERTAAETRSLADQAAGDLTRQKARVEANRRAPEDRELVAQELRRQIKLVIGERALLAGDDPANIGREVELAQQQQTLQGSLDYILARNSAASSPAAKAAAPAIMDGLAKAEQAAKEAEARAQKAEAELAQARQLKAVDDAANPILRGLQRQTDDAQDRQLQRAATGTLGKSIRETLRGASFAEETFDGRFYHDAGQQQRDRAAVASRNRTAAVGFSGAIAKANDVAGKLGDGQNDAADAAELDAILTRIGHHIDANTRRQLAPLVQALRRLEAQVRNGREGK